jgi:enoyl-[acyl-carrier-protein] reductase (NADH)
MVSYLSLISSQQKIALEVFEVMGRNPLIDVAIELVYQHSTYSFRNVWHSLTSILSKGTCTLMLTFTAA